MRSDQHLLAHLIRAGYLTESGLSRRARLRYCQCGLIVMAGLDGEVCAFEAECDPRPLTALGEAAAYLAGLRTWSLRNGRGRFELYPRNAAEITRHPAGTRARCDVLAEHRCGVRLPVSSFGRSSFPETAPPLPPGSPAPF